METAVEVIATSKVFQRGKVQLPSEVRERLNLKDGDKVVWFQFQGRIYVRKALPDLFRLTDSGRIEELKKREG